MLFRGSYQQAKKFCKKNGIKVKAVEYVKGGTRLMVMVPTDVVLRNGDVLLARGPRVLRINKAEPVEEKTVVEEPKP